jgi:chromate transport protein ChrA
VGTLVIIHAGLAQTGVYLFIALGVWAVFHRIRLQPLSASWFGAAVIAELVMVIQFIIGFVLYSQGLGANLPRAFVHILYACVTVVLLPAAYGYVSRIEDENVKTILMAIVCFFLMEIVIRTGAVAVV